MIPEAKGLTLFLCGFVFIFFSKEVDSVERKIPDYVIKCSRSALAEKNDSCVYDDIKILLPKLREGIPEFHLPPLDPFFVESIVVASPNFRAELTNCSVSNGIHVKLLNGTFDYKKLMFNVNLHYNFLHIDATYQISGRLLMLQLESQGALSMNVSNFEAFVEMHADIRKDHGKNYINFSNKSQQIIQLTFNEKPVLYFDNLFPKSNELTKTTNAIINDNIIEIIRDLIPIVEEAIGTVVFNAVQTTFDLFSVDELFLP